MSDELRERFDELTVDLECQEAMLSCIYHATEEAADIVIQEAVYGVQRKIESIRKEIDDIYDVLLKAS